MGHPYLNITTDDELRQFCRRLADSPMVAFDTEFVSERSYRPVLCLVQVASQGELALIDPLSVGDMTPFWQVVSEPGHETVVHAGRIELEFCLQAAGRPLAGPFDVQLAAGLVGLEYPAGYGTLISRVLGASPHKAETRTDWRRRPLTPRQIEYALDDIRYLPEISRRLKERLAKLGRTPWMEEEMAAWLAEVQEALSQDRWRRVSGNSALGARGLAVVRELWAWREAEAQHRDCPARRVLRDDLIVELARRQTADPKRIQAVRGLDRGDLKRQIPKIAEAIQRALELDAAELPHTVRHERAPQLSVLGQFLFSALGSICRAASLAPGLVGNPNDVRELIAYRTGHNRPGRVPRLERGWRAGVVGTVFDDLLAGKLSVRVADAESDAPLVLEPVRQSEDTRPK